MTQMTRDTAVALLKEYRQVIIALDSAGTIAAGIDDCGEMKRVREVVGGMLQTIWTELATPILQCYPEFPRDDPTLSFVDDY